MQLTSGQKVKLARLRLGLTLAKLSEQTSFSISYLSKIESDQRPVPDLLYALLKVDETVKWYEDFIEAARKHLGDKAEEALSYLERALKL